MKLRLEKYSYRLGEQVINSKMSLKQEIESILTDPEIYIPNLSRPQFNKILLEKFSTAGWNTKKSMDNLQEDLPIKIAFIKDRVGIKITFGHPSFLGLDLLKFQLYSFSDLNIIDIGVYIVTTKNFHKIMRSKFDKNWNGSLHFEKVKSYLPNFKSAIHLPIFVIGIDL